MARVNWPLACSSNSMSKITEASRDHISGDNFAFPKQRKEPIHDAAHVRNAIARFKQVQGVTSAERDAAWKRIKAAAKKHKVDRKSTRLNSSHLGISHAVFCLKT